MVAQNRHYVFLAIGVALIVAVMLSPYGLPTGLPGVVFWVCVAAAAALSALPLIFSRLGRDLSSATWAYLTLGLLICAGLAMRLGALAYWGQYPLEADANDYLNIAANSNLLELSGWTSRSPLFNLYVWLSGSALGFTPAVLRASGILASLAVLPLVYLVARRFFGFFPSLVVAGFFAVLPAFAWNAVRGLREDLVALLILGIFLLIVRPNSADDAANRDVSMKTDDRLTRAAFAGVLIGLLGVLRSDVLLMVGALILWAMIERRIGWKFLVTSAAVASLFIGAHLGAINAQFGSPSHYAGQFARGWANMEFAGEPGFPSKAAVEKDIFQGGPLSAFEYVFGMHSPGELTMRILKNEFVLLPVASTYYFFRSHTDFYTPAQGTGVATKTAERSPEGELKGLNLEKAVTLVAAGLACLLAAAGLFAVARTPARILGAAALLGILNYSFLPFDLFDYRLVSFVMPFEAMLVMAGAMFLAQKFVVKRFSGADHS